MFNHTTIFIQILLTCLTIYGGIKNINLIYSFLYHFYNFLHDNNPLLIDDYSDHSELKEIDIEKSIVKKQEPIYEVKYLEKFKI